MQTKILKYAELNMNKATSNGQLIFDNKNKLPFKEYIRGVYKALGLKYPKFFKMDELCQLAVITTEMLLGEGSDYSGEHTALILGNKNSSLVSDTNHYATISSEENYFPSPAVFVYTLPNIMLGEICIKHKITGENSCFMMEELDAKFLYEYASQLFKVEEYKHCITGFVDYEEEEYIAKLFLIGYDEDDQSSDSRFDENFNKNIP